jgi:hypothetical protein
MLWAISTIPKLVMADRRALAILPNLTNLFLNPSPSIEYAAISCCIAICRWNGNCAISHVLDPVLRRLSESPAVEYVRCLEQLIPVMSREVVQQRILAIALGFAKMSEGHQFAAGEILVILPFSMIEFTHGDFLSLLNSSVIVANYLVALVLTLGRRMRPNWVETILPKALILQANSFAHMRPGVVEAILSVLDRVDAQQAYVCCMSAFGWAANNEPVAVVLVDKADCLAQMRNGEFAAKLKDLGARLAQSTSGAIRVQLCSICARNPNTFLSSQVHFRRVIRLLAENSAINVRVAFVKNFHLLFSRTSSAHLKDMLFSYLLPYFSSEDDAIIDALFENSFLYLALKAIRINAILPYFLSIVDSLKRWRTIASAISIFLGFPEEIVQQSWRQMASLVKKRMSSSPHALASAAVNFYLTLADHTPEEELIPYLFEYTQSSQHQLRSFYFKVIVAVANSLSISTFMERLWPAAIRLAEDPVASVRITFLNVSGQLRRLFAQNFLSTAEMAITKMSMVMSKDSDPFVQLMCRECCECFKTSVTLSENESRISLKSGAAQLVRSAHILTAPVGISSIVLADGRPKAARVALSRTTVPPRPKPQRAKKWSLEGQRLRLPRIETDRL